MCDRNTPLTDPTADFVLADLLTATEDLIDFAINVFDTIRLQSHFNDRNRRVNLGLQLKDASDIQKNDYGIVDIPTKPCTVTTTLKYDLTLYLDRILQACKRTKANLMLLRVSRSRSTNSKLLLTASTNVRVEQLNKKVQLLTRLVKENGGEFLRKKQKKKKAFSDDKQNSNENTQIKQKTDKKPPSTLMSKEDLNDYVEISISFRMIIAKYHEFIQHVRAASKSAGQTSIANSLVLIPIAANAIKELNNILNRLARIAFAIEAESYHLRQPPNEDKELSDNQIVSKERNEPSERISDQYSSGLNLKQNTISLSKQNDIRNQSAMRSVSNINSFKLTPNIIANIFDDFFD